MAAIFEALPAVRLTVDATAELEAVPVYPPTAYVVLPGAGASNPVFVHRQTTPAATWTIPNTPGAKAVVLAVYDDAGRVGIADVTVTDTNTVITFSSPRTGRADFIRG